MHFQSLAHTTSWVKNELPSNPYFVFQDVTTLLDLIGTSNLSYGDFIDGQYNASRANNVNDSAARCAASFGRELPTLFGRVEHFSAGNHLASTHPLPSIHDYKRFNTPDNLLGMKQRIIGKMTTTFSKITTEISQRLGNVIATTVALNFLLNIQEVVFSLNSWIENLFNRNCLLPASHLRRKPSYLFVLASVAFSSNLKRYEHLLPLHRTILLHRRALIFGQYRRLIGCLMILCLHSGYHTHLPRES